MRAGYCVVNWRLPCSNFLQESNRWKLSIEIPVKELLNWKVLWLPLWKRVPWLQPGPEYHYGTIGTIQSSTKWRKQSSLSIDCGLSDWIKIKFLEITGWISWYRKSNSCLTRFCEAVSTYSNHIKYSQPQSFAGMCMFPVKEKYFGKLLWSYLKNQWKF
jgi:hypothetical protein